MFTEMFFLPVLFAATVPELARLISAAHGLVAVPLACIRRLFLKWHRAAVPSVKRISSWCWACSRRLAMSVRRIRQFIGHLKICPSRFRRAGRNNITRNTTNH